MTIPHQDHSTTNRELPDPYLNEAAATAIATAELIRAGEFDLAGYIIESTDPITLLEGFTNTLALAVQLIARHGGVAEEDVFDLLRAANNLVAAAAADGKPTLDEIPVAL